MGFIGIGSVILGYISVEFFKISVLKKDRKLLWAMLGSVFLTGCLGLLYGGFGFGVTMLDTQDPAGESYLIGAFTATYSFFGWFITGLLFFTSILVFWWLVIQLVVLVKKPTKNNDVEMTDEGHL